VELVSRVDGRDGVIEVSDDGPGFDETVLARVFERYQRGDRRGEAGIGLAIVKAIAGAHGGTATAANRAEGGAVVSLRIPLNRTAHQ
jgi:signal transduction histidine kinase